MGTKYCGFNWQVLSCGLLFLAFVVAPVFAQEPPLQIEASVSGPAIAGQELLYAITLLNKGQTPLKDLVVRARVPIGTTYLESDQFPDTKGWASGGLSRGKQGNVYWFRMEGELPPNERQLFYLKVLVASTGVDEVVLDDYAVSQTLNGPAIAGETLRTEVVRLTPPPTFTPVPTPVPTLTPVLAPHTPTPALPPTLVVPTMPPTQSSTSVPSSPVVMIELGVVIIIVVIVVRIGVARLKNP